MKIWSVETADKHYSIFILRRDALCKRCRTKRSTDTSHFYERHHSGTRYDPRNSDGLCRGCHTQWEGRRNGAIEFKKKQLGEEGYKELESLYRGTTKRTDAIIKFMNLYGKNN